MNPQGDLQLMKELRCMLQPKGLLFLAVPIGPDMVCKGIEMDKVKNIDYLEYGQKIWRNKTASITAGLENQTKIWLG